MKILYVDLKFEYGDPSRGINQIGEFGFHQVFKSLGHDVVTFYYEEYLKKTSELQSLLLGVADKENPDLIFFSLYTNQFEVQTLNKLTSKYKTINWFGDDQWRFDSFTKKYAKCFTYSITTDPFAIPKYKGMGYENVILSQWAALNAVAPNGEKSYKYDISFVGGSHSVRRWIVQEFKKQGLHVNTFGFGWPKGPVSLAEMQNIFLQSKINLNLSNSVNWDIRYLLHSWKNILVRAKSKKTVNQMKARNFEIPYFEGFQLAEYLPTIENYFDIGKNIVCYSNVDEAIQLAKFYLENHDLREKIKSQSIIHVHLQHTYLHRFEKIFKQIGL